MRVCELTGKRANMAYNVSHANNKTKKRQSPNIQVKRVFLQEEGRFIRLHISTRSIRTINQIGLRDFCKKNGVDYDALVKEKTKRG